ncbi:MAG: aspartyl/asparaginyl beta-hydroxylase domain-containing protein [Polyangiales bacterium]
MSETNKRSLRARLEHAKWLAYQYASDVVLLVPQVLIRLTERGRTKFFDAKDFPWTAEIEAAWPEIAAEYAALRHAQIPTYQEIERINDGLTTDDKWRTYYVHFYGQSLARAERECPRTVAALARIPGIQFAMFSILAPGKHVPAHRGPYNGVLRYHLGVDVPEGCEIRIADEHQRWQDGGSLVFDDSFEHEVWNRSGRARCVVFADVERPLPWPLCALNQFILRRAANSALSRDTLRNIRAWEASVQSPPELAAAPVRAEWTMET